MQLDMYVFRFYKMFFYSYFSQLDIDFEEFSYHFILDGKRTDTKYSLVNNIASNTIAHRLKYISLSYFSLFSEYFPVIYTNIGVGAKEGLLRN